MIIKIKNFTRKIQKYKKNTLSRIQTNLNYLNHKKVMPKHLFFGHSMHKNCQYRLAALNEQIELYKKYGKNKFVLVEIGNYLGESLEILGEHIHNSLKDNYLIISIDPYIPFGTPDEEFQNQDERGKRITLIQTMKKASDKIYYYFTNNMSHAIFKHNHFHLRMISNDAFKLLKSFNLKIDFCYVDGDHYYEHIKDDVENYSTILKSEDNYNGKICGHAYDLTYDEAKETFNFDDKKLYSILTKNKKNNYLILKNKLGKKQAFHHGLTLFFHETDFKIKKFPSAFWCKFN